MEQFEAPFSIQNLMSAAQKFLDKLHHLETELNLLLTHINNQTNTKVVSMGDEEFIAIFENNPQDQNSETNDDLELSDDYEDLEEDENESNNEYELIVEQPIIDVVDTWEKLEKIFGPDFLERCQDFIQELEEELTNLGSNIRSLHHAEDYFRESLDIVTRTLISGQIALNDMDVFNASPLETGPIQNNIDVLEEHASDIENYEKILVEMEKARNIFPNEEEENEENDGVLEDEES